MRINQPTPPEALVKLDAFKTWLVQRGAELLSITNEYELVRFRTGKGVSIIYRSNNPDKPCSCIGDALQAWREFQNPETKWRAIPATRRKPSVSLDYRTVRARDGNECFFCAEYIPEGEGTIEHLIPVTHGGPQHISNKFLAHKECNEKAGCLSAPEKIAVYYKARLEKLLRRIDEQGRRDRIASAANLAQAGNGQEGKVPLEI